MVSLVLVVDYLPLVSSDTGEGGLGKKCIHLTSSVELKKYIEHHQGSDIYKL